MEGVDISPFINGLPAGRSTTDFSTEDASGSTSQAANIQVQRIKTTEVAAPAQAARCATCFHMAAPTLQWRQAAVTYQKIDFACMQEALEVGATTLLLDEDTCASNFMHRDARMRVRFPSHWLCDRVPLLQATWSTATNQSCRKPCEMPAAHVLMQALVPKDPITPFSERIGSLSAAGVSCVRLVSSANAMPTVPPAVTRCFSI